MRTLCDFVRLAVVELAEIELVLRAVHVPEHRLVGIDEIVAHDIRVIDADGHTVFGVAVAVHLNIRSGVALVEVSSVVAAALCAVQRSGKLLCGSVCVVVSGCGCRLLWGMHAIAVAKRQIERRVAYEIVVAFQPYVCTVDHIGADDVDKGLVGLVVVIRSEFVPQKTPTPSAVSLSFSSRPLFAS